MSSVNVPTSYWQMEFEEIVVKPFKIQSPDESSHFVLWSKVLVSLLIPMTEAILNYRGRTPKPMVYSITHISFASITRVISAWNIIDKITFHNYLGTYFWMRVHLIIIIWYVLWSFSITFCLYFVHTHINNYNLHALYTSYLCSKKLCWQYFILWNF